MADTFRVVAIIASFNEGDIISSAIAHLVDQGVDVYLIDNRSTDDTVARARPWLNKGLISIEVFPREPPPAGALHLFSLGAILARKEKLANELSADWFINHDADEFREAPWPGMTLHEAIRWVDRLGYNCIDFRVLNFPPLGDGFRPGEDLSRHFTHWEDPFVYDSLQRRCWKAQSVPASLVTSGGHEALFPDRRVFPIRFLMRHYPIRSQEHGEKKIFAERKNRFDQSERAKGWHVQYESVDEGHSFLGDPSKLRAYDPDRVRLALMLDSEPARLAEDKVRQLSALADARQKDLETVAVLKHEAERHAANLEKDRERLTDHLIERERHVANLETTNAHLERHASGLETDRATLSKHIEHLEAVRDHLESIRLDREKHAANLETTVAQLQRHAAALEKDRQTLWTHISERERHIGHLESARAEAERHGANLDSLASRLREEMEMLRSEVARQTARLEEIQKERGMLSAELEAIRRSTSWRATAPFRRIADWFRGKG